MIEELVTWAKVITIIVVIGGIVFAIPIAGVAIAIMALIVFIYTALFSDKEDST